MTLEKFIYSVGFTHLFSPGRFLSLSFEADWTVGGILNLDQHSDSKNIHVNMLFHFRDI